MKSYPCGGTALAAFQVIPYPCGGAALAAFQVIPYPGGIASYKAYIVPHLNYCNIIWGNSSNFNVSKMTMLQKRACKIIIGTEYTNFESAKATLNIQSSEESVFLNKAKIMYKDSK